MEVEERFAIDIPDRDAEKILTVRDLHEFVCNAVDAVELDAACPSRTAFYSLRRQLISLGVPRSQVRRSQDVVHLFPSERRRSTWLELRRWWLPSLPRLELPPVAASGLSLVVFFAGIGSVILFALGLEHAGQRAFYITLCVTAAVCAAAAALVLVSQPLARTAPVRSRTVEDLVRLKVADDVRESDHRSRHWTRSAVLHELQGIIADVLGLEREAVQPESRFIEDLGAG